MIVAGFGFRAAAQTASLRDAYDAARADRVAGCFSTLTNKAGHAGFQELAEMLGSEMCAVSLGDMQDVITPTQSAASQRAYGVGSVAEAAALAAAGPNAKLLAPRVVSADGLATCALAEGGNG